MISHRAREEHSHKDGEHVIELASELEDDDGGRDGARDAGSHRGGADHRITGRGDLRCHVESGPGGGVRATAAQ